MLASEKRLVKPSLYFTELPKRSRLTHTHKMSLVAHIHCLVGKIIGLQGGNKEVAIVACTG